MEKSIKSVASSYGIALGLALILISVLAYVFSLSLFSAWWFGISLLVLIIVWGIVATSKAKKTTAALFTFKNAFTAYFVTILIGSFLSMVFSILLFNIIDPEASKAILEATIENTRGMMESFGAPQSEIDKAVEKMQNENSFAPLKQLQAYAFQLVFYAVIGLLVALIFREKDPNK